MALYYVISMWIFTFKVCWKIPCCEAFYFVETIQLICGASQVSGICIAWVFTGKNIRIDYRFCCFNINKLSCYVIFRQGSWTTDSLAPYLDARQYRSVEGGKLVVSLIALHKISFSVHMMPEYYLKISYLVRSILLIVLFCIFWITFCAKLCLGTSRHAISLFYVFILIYYLLWCSFLSVLFGSIKVNSSPIPSSGQWQCFSICHWNLNSITAHNYAKSPLLTAYNLVHNFEIICISDIYDMSGITGL